MVDSQCKIRMLLAVATEAVADAINVLLQDNTDIEIVAVVTSAEELLPKVQEKSPHVVCIDTRIDDRWDEYAKQVSDYSNQLQEDPLYHPYSHNSIENANWLKGSRQRLAKRILIGAIGNRDEENSIMLKGMPSGVSFHLHTPLENAQFESMIEVIVAHYGWLLKWLADNP